MTSLSSKRFTMDSRVEAKPNKPANSGDVALLSDINTSAGCTSFTQNTGSAWNKTDWTKSLGKGSTITSENVSRREVSSPRSKEEKDSSKVEAQSPAGNCVSNNPGIKQLQSPVGFELLPSSPVLKKKNSPDPRPTSPLTSCSIDTPPVVRSSLEQDHQIEVEKKSGSINEGLVPSSSSHFFFGSADNAVLPPVATMSMPTNSVPEYTSQTVISDNSVSLCVNISPDKSVPREVDNFEEFLSPRNPVTLSMPVSDSLNSSALNPKPKINSDIQTIGGLSPVSAPVRTPIQRPAPIELPISKLLPSNIVDEVHVTGDQFPSITEPWGLRSLSLDYPRDAFKQFKWQMWDTPQLGQSNLPNSAEPSWLPVGNGMFEKSKDFLPPCSEGTLASPFEPETHLPSSLFSPQQKSNEFNQNSSNHIGGASVSSSNSLWLNQPAFESAEGSWNISTLHRLPPTFSNGGTQGEVEDSIVTMDGCPYEPTSTGFWLKSGMDDTEKKKWSAEGAAENSCWLSTIKSSERPHIAGIYPPSHFSNNSQNECKMVNQFCWVNISLVLTPKRTLDLQKMDSVKQDSVDLVVRALVEKFEIGKSHDEEEDVEEREEETPVVKEKRGVSEEAETIDEELLSVVKSSLLTSVPVLFKPVKVPIKGVNISKNFDISGHTDATCWKLHPKLHPKNRTRDSKKFMTTVKIDGEVEIEDDSDVDERLGCMATNMNNQEQEEEISKLFQIEIQIKRTKSPYLYTRDAIFVRRENRYRWVKDGINYNIQEHQRKTKIAMEILVGEYRGKETTPRAIGPRGNMPNHLTMRFTYFDGVEEGWFLEDVHQLSSLEQDHHKE
ncbi:hypothetical protein KI387_007030 [Taxus chinensis]|uniref:Uncharacterized protein n=1 Tax=Taxus chinensis TaxID=29808 RepID=A0AA38GR46_TAXCH|nr:hypothetical protein KI387_007030 [Taxus chinensis]